MRLIVLIIICTTICTQTEVFSQKHDSTYWSSWSKLYKIIDSSFYNRSDTSILEQTALVQLSLKNGIIDTFFIWSIYEKEISNWMIPFFKSTVNRYFEGYKQFKYVIVPIRFVDTGKENKLTFSTDFDFIANLIDAFKHSFNKTVTISQGLLLEAPWQKPKSSR